MENYAGVEGLYPKFFQAEYDLNLYEMITGYTGNVLIIHGLKDGMVPFTASVKAIEECYDKQLAELVVIAGEKSDHGFENVWIGYNEGAKMAADAMMSALANWQSGYAD